MFEDVFLASGMVFVRWQPWKLVASWLFQEKVGTWGWDTVWMGQRNPAPPIQDG